MKTRIKEAFKEIQAEDNLKFRTKTNVLNSLNQNRNHYRLKWFSFPRIASICLSLILIVIGVQWLYFSQTALISIDINPSIELGVNRFDRIISSKSLNNDGENLLKNLNLINKTSSEAVMEVLNNQQIIKLESDNETINITVSCKNQNQSDILLNQMKHCTEGHNNAHCQVISPEEAREAQSLGLPNGKYREYLILKAYDPAITPEEISKLTMREIRDLINSYENPSSQDNLSSQTWESSGNQEHSQQNRFKHHNQNHE